MMSGAFWDGGPVRLTESVLTRKVTTSDRSIERFTKDLRDKIMDTKSELDKTIQSIGKEDAEHVLDWDESNLEVEGLEGLVDKDMAEVQADQYEVKLREAYKLQHQAAQYIVDLKRQCRDVDNVRQTLAEQAKDANKSILTALAKVENASQLADIEFKIGTLQFY